MMNVLVTATGGDLGQAVVKALQQSSLDITCYGCDMDPDGVGGLFVEDFYTVPRADDQRYLGTVRAICEQVKADAVIPASEPEMYALVHRDGLPPIVCQDFAWMTRYGDKLSCYRALQADGIELAPFACGRDPDAAASLVAKTGYPVVVKARRSWGSKSLRIAENEVELGAAIAKTRLPVVQAYIDGDEYSVGVFACDGFTEALAFKRDLRGFGLSWYAETSWSFPVVKYATHIARATGLRGSANVQVRESKAGVRLLEINPRFSSLAAARAAAGFNDVEWSLLLALGKKLERPWPAPRCMRFQRYFQEVVDFGSGWKDLRG